ncbi:MAG: hypothetical protein JNJ88_03745, partial [Planctomycetes bacterium]|nr:hypothetical protein [Planctomycetota bacterium]
GKDYKYEWDAFNRLVRVKNQSNVLVEEYRYNGLGFRIGWHADSDSDGDVDSNDKWYYLAYDEAWRMVAVFRESDTAPKEEFVPHLAGSDGFGRSSQLDGVILRYKDANTAWTSASDGTLEEKRYYAQNWRGDVVAIVSSAGAMYEWVKYSPYGIPFGMPAADTESDGDCDATDITQIQTWINGSAYDVRGDLDLDGDVDTTDKSTAQGSFQGISSGPSVLSAGGVENRKGYTGYERSVRISGHWHARHRVLLADLGRWLHRDPLGYADGLNTYSFVALRPLVAIDPLGLEGSCPCKAKWTFESPISVNPIIGPGIPPIAFKLVSAPFQTGSGKKHEVKECLEIDGYDNMISYKHDAPCNEKCRFEIDSRLFHLDDQADPQTHGSGGSQPPTTDLTSGPPAPSSTPPNETTGGWSGVALGSYGYYLMHGVSDPSPTGSPTWSSSGGTDLKVVSGAGVQMPAGDSRPNLKGTVHVPCGGPAYEQEITSHSALGGISIKLKIKLDCSKCDGTFTSASGARQLDAASTSLSVASSWHSILY